MSYLCNSLVVWNAHGLEFGSQHLKRKENYTFQFKKKKILITFLTWWISFIITLEEFLSTQKKKKIPIRNPSAGYFTVCASLTSQIWPLFHRPGSPPSLWYLLLFKHEVGGHQGSFFTTLLIFWDRASRWTWSSMIHGGCLTLNSTVSVVPGSTRGGHRLCCRSWLIASLPNNWAIPPDLF